MTQPPGIPYETIDPQFLSDIGHLRTLAICHYVWGGITIVFSSIFLIHVAMGIMVMAGGFPGPAGPGAGGPPPQLFGLLFVVMGGIAIALGWTLGILTIFSGRFMTSRRRRTFSIDIAAINCASFPLGTLLGVFTIIVLVRPSVRFLYDRTGIPSAG